MSYTVVIWINEKSWAFTYPDADDAQVAMIQFIREFGKRLEPHQLNQIHIGPTAEPSVTPGG